MRSSQTSDELLAHFDRPKVHVCPEFEWDEAAIGPPCFERPARAYTGPESIGLHEKLDEPPRPVRDTRWVLKWVAAAAVFATAGRVLFEFAGAISTEQAFHQAAQAGAVEAT